MKKRVNLATVFALMLLTSVVTFLATRMLAQNQLRAKLETTEQLETSTALFVDARKAILERFVGETDEETLNRGAVKGMMEAINDQWSYYMSPEQYAEQVKTDKSMVGIGVSIAEDDGEMIVIEVYDGSPAAEIGVKPGFHIIAVEGENVADIGFDAAVERVRGTEHTAVNITFADENGAHVTYNIIRKSVTRQMVLSEVLEHRIGYIRVHGFETRVDDDFEEAVRRHQDSGVTGLIIDVRNNPGGLVPVMAKMLDLLLPKGRLITLQSKSGVEEHYDSTASCVELPIVVLINEDSYSAAEFFAACLSEYEWAVTVGGKTTGKGYAQTDYKLLDGSGLHLSTKKYFTPSGKSLAGTGLTPDYPVELPSTIKHLSFTNHANDTQFEKAVAVMLEKIGDGEESEEDAA